MRGHFKVWFVTQVHPSVHLAQGDPCSFTECGCSTWIALGTTEEVCTKAQATEAEGTNRRISGSISTFRSEYLRLTRESADSGPLGTTTSEQCPRCKRSCSLLLRPSLTEILCSVAMQPTSPQMESPFSWHQTTP